MRLHINPARPPMGSVSDNDSHPLTCGYDPFRLYLPGLQPREYVVNCLLKAASPSLA